MSGSLGVDEGGPSHSLWIEEDQLIRRGRGAYRSLGVDGGGPATKDSRGDETARLYGNGKTSAKMGGLCKEDCSKGRGWRKKAVDRRNGKKRQCIH